MLIDLRRDLRSGFGLIFEVATRCSTLYDRTVIGSDISLLRTTDGKDLLSKVAIQLEGILGSVDRKHDGIRHTQSHKTEVLGPSGMFEKSGIRIDLLPPMGVVDRMIMVDRVRVRALESTIDGGNLQVK